MSKIRLFISKPMFSKGVIQLDMKKHIHYLKDVMRLKCGRTINIFNEVDGEWTATIREINKNSVILEVIDNIIKPEKRDLDLCLCFALTKSHTLQSVIRQATELGVTKLQPIITDHTTVRNINLERLKICVIEAAEQCERITIPKIFSTITFYEACQKYQNLVICDESGKGKDPQEAFSKMSDTAILVGPEGGFSCNELEYKGVERITLGKEILRVDTAVVSAIAYFKAFSSYQISYE